MVWTDKQSETCDKTDIQIHTNTFTHTHTHTHTHTPAIPVWDEVEQQAEYKYLLCLNDLQISRQNNKMMTTKRYTQFRATEEYREFIYLFIQN